MNPSLLYRRSWDAAELVRRHPPELSCERKRRVFALACPAGSVPRGEVSASRWGAADLPAHIDVGSALRRLEVRRGYYTYATALAGTVEWHVNFAHSDLFAFYGSSLFAQDEWQVAEHPALGSLREALRSAGESLRTEERGRATPILVHGVERCCEVRTNPDATAERPRGLYGREFETASLRAIGRAVRRVEPPTLTNIVAIVAPGYGEGVYQVSELRQILSTAYAGFRAAVLESEFQAGHPVPVVMHTGFWGCGAFGGNRIVMTALQILAAELADVRTLVFQHGEVAGLSAVNEAASTLRALTAESSTAGVLERIESLRLVWGKSNGT